MATDVITMLVVGVVGLAVLGLAAIYLWVLGIAYRESPRGKRDRGEL